MAGGTVPAKWKSEKAMQLAKREVPAMLEPLDYKPTTPKDDIDMMQISKRPSHAGKHVKSRPHVLESLATSPQYNFVSEVPTPEKV